MKEITIYIKDILECIQRIEQYTAGVSREEFMKDYELQDAVIRRLSIIGEAVKNVPEEIREKYQVIPWRKIAGMRDMLMHEYAAVNVERVWAVVDKDLPELKSQIQQVRF